MALSFLHPVQKLLGASADLHFSASGFSLQADAFTFCNTSGSDVTVSMWITQGGAPSDASLILINFPVTAGATKAAFDLRGHVLEDGMQLYAKASVAGVVTLAVSGRKQVTV